MLLDTPGLTTLQGLIALILGFLALGLQGYALFDATRQRPAAFPAAGKQTKRLWLILLAVAVGIGIISLTSVLNIFNLLAVVVAAVYLVDVRPAVRGMTGGGTSGPYGRW